MRQEELEEIQSRKHTLSELCIDIGNGQAVITKDDLVEFNDCLPISISEMEYVIREAKNYISFRNQRITENLFEEFPEIPDIPHSKYISSEEHDFIIKRFNELVSKFPEGNDMAVIYDKNDGNDIVFVSTWNIKCGIATYTGHLYDSIKKAENSFPLNIHPISAGIDYMGTGLVHFQHEFGIIPRIPGRRVK